MKFGVPGGFPWLGLEFGGLRRFMVLILCSACSGLEFVILVLLGFVLLRFAVLG